MPRNRMPKEYMITNNSTKDHTSERIVWMMENTKTLKARTNRKTCQDESLERTMIFQEGVFSMLTSWSIRMCSYTVKNTTNTVNIYLHNIAW